MPQQLLCATIENIANKAMAMNIGDIQQLKALADKSLCVHLEELGFPLCFMLTKNTAKNINESSQAYFPYIFIVNQLNDNADCVINTSVNTLMAIQESQSLTELIKEDKLDIQGDIKIAQHFAQVMENIRIDWGSEIAEHIGDYPTYKLSLLGKDLWAKAKFAKEQISADSSEWLVQESKLVVAKSEIAQFNNAVAQVSHAANTLNERLEKLLQRHQTLSSTP